MIKLTEQLTKNCEKLAHQLQPVSSYKEWLQQNIFKTEKILCLDLEIHPQTKQLLEGAMIIGHQVWFFQADDVLHHKQDIILLIQQAPLLLGHNLIEFDLKYLCQFLHVEDDLASWRTKSIDTLYLSSLLLPHQPSHALVKLYKSQKNINNPIQDCLESRVLWQICQNEWQQLPDLFQNIFYRLLPQLSQYDLYLTHDFIFDLEHLKDYLPQGNYQQLFVLLNSAFKITRTQKNSWQYLGLAVFVNWLRFFDKPQARRPVWINKHIEHHTSFRNAESAF